MSKQTIKDKSLKIRNETRRHANTRGRVADVIDELNESKADLVDGKVPLDQLPEIPDEGIISIQEGERITIDVTDPQNPIITAKEELTGTFLVNKGVGGYSPGDTFPEGMTLTDAFKSLLTTIYNAKFTEPTLSIKLNVTGLREVGEVLSLVITNTFNRGSINGGYDGVLWNESKNMGPAVGLSTTHVIDGTTFNVSTEVQSKTIESYLIPLGTTVFNGSVTYSAGIQPVNSQGELQQAHAGGVVTASTNLTSVIPYFYGFINENQTANDINISSLTKVIAVSTGTVNIPFSNVVGKKLVVIVPSTSPLKTKWYVNALNNGSIGNNGDLFSVTTNNYSSPDLRWGSTPFRVYISTPTTINETVQLQN